MLNDGMLVVMVLVLVPRGAGGAEHGRRRDGPDLRNRDRRLRQLREDERLVATVVAAAAAPVDARCAVPTYWNHNHLSW